MGPARINNEKPNCAPQLDRTWTSQRQTKRFVWVRSAKQNLWHRSRGTALHPGVMRAHCQNLSDDTDMMTLGTVFACLFMPHFQGSGLFLHRMTQWSASPLANGLPYWMNLPHFHSCTFLALLWINTPGLFSLQCLEAFSCEVLS
jgi:hypothetical protein